MRADIGEEKAKQAALSHFCRINSEWPKAHVQNIQRQGTDYIVSLMPENRTGILLFFVTYKVWVNAATGVVEKIV